MAAPVLRFQQAALPVLALALAGCASDHHVSPWPQGVTLRSLMRPAAVEEHVARVDEEMRTEGMALDQEVEGSFGDGEPFRILAYVGQDELGNPKTALRVATRYGVVMALGPTSPHEALRGEVVSFLPAIGEAGSWASGSDINGDGLPDVLVSRTGGILEVWGLHPKGASPYPIDAAAPMTEAVDVDGDGRPDLQGEVPVPVNDAIGPRLVEVATFADGRYRPDTPSVRAFHRDRLAELRGQRGRSARHQVERAWHGLRAGREPEEALERLDEGMEASSLDEREDASLAYWRGWLAARFVEP